MATKRSPIEQPVTQVTQNVVTNTDSADGPSLDDAWAAAVKEVGEEQAAAEGAAPEAKPAEGEKPAEGAPAEPAEAKPEERPEPAKETPDRNKAWGAIARAEKKTRELEHRLKEQEAALAARAKELEAAASVSALAKKDPLKFLEAHGLTIQDIVDTAVDGQLPMSLKMREEEARLEAKRQEVEAIAKRAEGVAKQLEVQRLKEQVETYQDNIYQMLRQNDDRFAMLLEDSGRDAATHIFNVMSDHYVKTGESLNPEAVAEHLENELAKMTAMKYERTEQILRKRGLLKSGAAPEQAPQAKTEVAVPGKPAKPAQTPPQAPPAPQAEEKPFRRGMAADEDDFEEALEFFKANKRK